VSARALRRASRSVVLGLVIAATTAGPTSAQAGAVVEGRIYDAASGAGIENALGRLEAAQQQYRAWAELDQAIIDIQEAVHDRKNTLAVQQILTELVGTILGNALRTGLH